MVLVLNVECSCKNVSFNNGSHKSDTCKLLDPQFSTKYSFFLPENDIVTKLMRMVSTVTVRIFSSLLGECQCARV